MTTMRELSSGAVSSAVPASGALKAAWRALLRSDTSPAWAAVAADELDATLADHAHCEKKAASSALSLLNAYPDDDELVRAMLALAQEELGHFAEVYRVLRHRQATLSRDHGDPYVQALLAQVRQPPALRKIDRLLISALIEARSCERFHLLSAELARRGEQAMAALFERFANSEAGHAVLFVGLAQREEPAARDQTIPKRLAELAQLEAEIVARLPILARIH